MAALVGSIDQGTSSTRLFILIDFSFFYFSNHLLASCPSTSTQIRFMVFEAGSGQVVGQHQQEVKQLFPHER